MLRRVTLSWTLLALAIAILPARDSASAQERPFDVVARTRALMAPVTAATQARDSLARLAAHASGEEAKVFEELAWGRQHDAHDALIAAVQEVDGWRKQGRDVAPAVAIVGEAARADWPRFRAMIERNLQTGRSLQEARDAATGASRLALEAEISRRSARISQMSEDMVDDLLALEGLGLDMRARRAFAIERITAIAEQLTARIRVLKDARALTAARASRPADDPALRDEMAATDEALRRASGSLDTAISLLDRLGIDTTTLTVGFTLATGKLTADALRPAVLMGVFRAWQARFLDMLSTQAPRWIFQLVVIALILAGFRLLAALARRIVRRAVERAAISHLLRDMITRTSATVVMAIGFVLVLRQLGVDLGPIFAGLGIAGFVVGFAMQSTLSNFAAGGLLLFYQPFDVGDVIDAGGALGTVQRMNLVSTTILTFDNQTLIVPNGKIWGDVIRNITRQDTRRVDLTFGVGYESDVAKVEEILKDAVERHPFALKEPAAVVRLHQLADSSLNFVVRVWARKEHYWDVYWDLTRTAKERFDAAGIKIPFPQREVHVNMLGDTPREPV